MKLVTRGLRKEEVRWAGKCGCCNSYFTAKFSDLRLCKNPFSREFLRYCAPCEVCETRVRFINTQNKVSPND